MNIESKVTPVETECSEASVLHGGGSRVADGMAEHSAVARVGLDGLPKRLKHALVIGKPVGTSKRKVAE